MRVLLVGNPDPTHVGAHFLAASVEIGLDVSFVDVRRAASPHRLLNSLYWRLADRWSPRGEAFERLVLDEVGRHKAQAVVGIGLLPLRAAALAELARRGIRTAVYLTDDPWNPAMSAQWLLGSLPHWGSVFTTRRSNIDDLVDLGCRRVAYLPFAYAPATHFAVPSRGPFEFDVLFVGGADADRIPYFEALNRSGLVVGLYGGYWGGIRSLRSLARGFAGPEEVRSLVSRSRTALGLVRRANRDGSSMRSFELPAMGACFTAEDTSEHRTLFGPEGDAVLYFDGISEACEKTEALCRDSAMRSRLAEAVRARITTGRHTYADRLREIVMGA